MRKIKICRNTNGDSRVATKVPTFREFHRSNSEHCENIREMILNFAEDIKWQGENMIGQRKKNHISQCFIATCVIPLKVE